MVICLQVFFGGGLRNFIPEEELIPGHGEYGDRRDGVNLVDVNKILTILFSFYKKMFSIIFY